jgi:pimeloyl-ACP methyl ester carboxylesterase
MQLETPLPRQAHTIELHRFPADENRPDVIALHGLMQTLHSWRHLRPKLAGRGKRLCAFDLKGHGGSPCPADGKYSLEDHAAPILAFIRDNDLHGLTLVGHSFGGSVALLVAARLMEEGKRRLAALVLVNSFFDPSALRIRLLRGLALSAGPVAAPLLQWEPLARLAVRIGGWTLCRRHDHVDDAIVTSYAANLRQRDRVDALIETGRQITTADYVGLQQKLPTIDVPTLIVWGRQERLLPFASCADLHRKFPNAQLFPVEDCGHIPHEEQCEIVTEKIAAFVATHTARRA